MCLKLLRKEELCPFSILLMVSESTGHRILFRYPPRGLEDFPAGCECCANDDFVEKEASSTEGQKQASANFHAVAFSKRRGHSKAKSLTPQFEEAYGACLRLLKDLSDSMLEGLLGRNHEQRLDLRLNCLQIVGQTMKLQSSLNEQIHLLDAIEYCWQLISPKDSEPALVRRDAMSGTFSIAFILHGNAPQYVTESYWNLANMLSIQLRREEYYRHFLSEQRDLMTQVLDDASDESVDSRDSSGEDLCELLCHKCLLCKELANLIDNLRYHRRHSVNIILNRRSTQIYHPPYGITLVQGNVHLDYDMLCKAADGLKAEHMVLWCRSKSPPKQLPSPIDPVVFLRVLDCSRNLLDLSLKLNLVVDDVLAMVRHWVRLGQAIFISPICETNRYVLNPEIRYFLCERVLSSFNEHFALFNLPRILALLSNSENLRHFFRELELSILRRSDSLVSERWHKEPTVSQAPASALLGLPVQHQQAKRFPSMMSCLNVTSIDKVALATEHSSKASNSDVEDADLKEFTGLTPYVSDTTAEGSASPTPKVESLFARSSTTTKSGELDIVIHRLLKWLLRNSLIIRLHERLYWNLPRSMLFDIRSYISRPLCHSEFPISERFGEAMFLRAKTVFPVSSELHCFLLLPEVSAVSKDMLSVFLDVVPHEGGELEDILAATNRRRHEVLQCIDHFSFLMTICYLPDPITSIFAGLSS